MADSFTADFSQVKLSQQQLDAFVQIMEKGIVTISNQYAVILRDRIRANATGAPGPQVVTGQYISTIQVTDDQQPTVASSAPQAPRLEYGFMGTDALGRVYNQPPFPHWQPAIDVTEPEYIQALTDALPVWWQDAAKT